MKWYAQLFARRPRAVLSFALGVTALALFGMSRVRFDDVPRGFFKGEDENFQRLLQLYEEFGSDDNDVLFVLESEDWFTPRAVECLRELSERIRNVDEVAATAGLVDIPVFPEGGGWLPRALLPMPASSTEAFEQARARARDHPLVRGRLISDDDRMTFFVARLEGEIDSITKIEPIVALMESLAEDLASEYAGVRVRVTGVPSCRVEIYNTLRSEQILFTAAGALLCFAIGWLLFRSFGAVLAVSLPPALGALWALGFAGLFGQKIDILGTVLPMLVIVIAFTDSVHLMIDMRIERKAGLSPRDSAASAIRHLGLPCALTSLTTAIGFGSLALGNVPIVQRFGWLCAQSVLLAFLAVLTTMPLLASWMPYIGTSEAGAGGGRPLWTRRFGSLIGVVTRRPGWVAVLGGVTSLALLAVSLRLEPDNRLTEAMPRESEAFQALIDVQEKLGGVLPLYVLLEWEGEQGLHSPTVRAALAETEELIRGVEGVSPPASILSLLGMLPGGLDEPEVWLEILPAEIRSRWYRPDLGKALVTAGVSDEGTSVMSPLFAEIQSGLAKIEERHRGVQLDLTGTDVVARGQVNRMIVDLARSLGVAVLVIFVVIAFEFRSWILGLCSLLPNLFPLVFVGALLVFLGIPLQMSSAVLFSVLLGLAVDDTIHFLARYRREVARDREQALERSFFAVGRAVLFTTLVLGSGFAIVLLSAVPTSRLFAGFVCVGLVAALVGDLVFLPALLRLVELARGRRAA